MTNPADFTGVPYVAGSIIGERCWRVDDGGRLHSPMQPFTWEPGENASKCNGSILMKRPAPQVFNIFKVEVFGDAEVEIVKIEIRDLNGTMMVFDSEANWIQRSPSHIHYDSTLQDVPGVILYWRRVEQYVDASYRFAVPQTVWENEENVTIETAYDIRTVRSPIYSNVCQHFIPYAQYLAIVGEHKYKDCSCGFYAYLNGVNELAITEPLVGIIEGYGETLIGKRGFRSQKAKILALAPTGQKALGVAGSSFSGNHVAASAGTHGTRIWVRGSEKDPIKAHKLSITKIVEQLGKPWERLKQNYPDIAFFEDADQMRAEFPATSLEEVMGDD